MEQRGFIYNDFETAMLHAQHGKVKWRAMNKQRRNRLQKVIDQLEELKVEVSSICEEEQEAYDNMPESLQDGERGSQMYENISTLEDQESNFDELIENLQELIEA